MIRIPEPSKSSLTPFTALPIPGIIAIVSPDSAPIKRLVQNAKESGMAIDATQGRKTKAVLVMENNQLVLSALLPETIASRAQVMDSGEDEDA